MKKLGWLVLFAAFALAVPLVRIIAWSFYPARRGARNGRIQIAGEAGCGDGSAAGLGVAGVRDHAQAGGLSGDTLRVEW